MDPLLPFYTVRLLSVSSSPNWYTLLSDVINPLRSSLCPTDIHIANYYNESHWNAVWAGFFLVTRLLPSGARRTLAYGGDLKESIDKGQAKLYTKDSISGDEVDVEWVDFETEAIGSALRKEFGFIL